MYTKQDINITVQEVAIHGELWYISNKTQKPLIVCCTGYSKEGYVNSSWEELRDVFIERELDVAILLWDYMGQRTSGGNIKELTPLLAVEQLHEIIKQVSSYSFIDSKNINIAATSFGGYVSLIYSAVYKNIKNLLLKSPVSDFALTREQEYDIEQWRQDGELTMRFGFKSTFNFYIQAKIIDIYNKVCPQIEANVLILHGTLDTIALLNQSIILSKNLTNAQLVVLDGVGHYYSEEGASEKFINTAIEWALQLKIHN